MVTNGNVSKQLGLFGIENNGMRYNTFAPQLHNLCTNRYGFEQGKIMPSRAFCSDENQGFPIILLTKHFGTFPFNHGQVGGVVATDRHGPHSHHGKDLVIVHASHVGYDRETGDFGIYRRLQTEGNEGTSTCGKLCGTLALYLNEFDYAKRKIFLQKNGENKVVCIDRGLLDEERQEGLFLNLSKIVGMEDDKAVIVDSHSTSIAYSASKQFLERLGDYSWKEGKGEHIGNKLSPDLFYFKRNLDGAVEGKDHIERQLLPYMSCIVASKHPALAAATANTRIEFDRAYRSIEQSEAFKGKKVFFISGLNIDISPEEGHIFPLTKFVPWAAYFRDSDGSSHTLEQEEIISLLSNQSIENPDQINLEDAIGMEEQEQEVTVNL